MNNYRKGLERVREQAEKKGYRFYTVGGDGVNNCSSLFINSFEIKTSTYDAEDMDMLAEVIADYDMKTVREVFCDKSITYASNGMYVKESYKSGKIDLSGLMEQVVNGSKISMGILESIEDKYISTDFSVTSAFKFGNAYITPYMPISILSDLIQNNINKELLNKFMNHYMGIKLDKLNKKVADNIAGFLFKEYMQGNKSILKELETV